MATRPCAPFVVYACHIVAFGSQRADAMRIGLRQLFDSNISSGLFTRAAFETHGMYSDRVKSSAGAFPSAILGVLLLILCLLGVIVLVLCLLSFRPKEAAKDGEAGAAETEHVAEDGSAALRQVPRRQRTPSKSWTATSDEALANTTAANATKSGVEFEESMRMVRVTTRFATTMCLVIAVTTVSLYFNIGAEVVRTAALDSMGDLISNSMTLYIGYRMSQIDKKRYPVGQTKFQSIGCLVFSTFMFALMVGNALGNIESLIESKDDVGQAAISRFFYTTKSLGGDFEEWNKAVTWNKGDKAFEWNDARNMNNPIKSFYLQANDESERSMAETLKATVTKGEVVDLAASYYNGAEEKAKLIFQNGFLSIPATYKFILFLYCTLYAVPKSKSSVLAVLAIDARNDSICTFSVIVVTSLAFWSKNLEDKCFGFIPEEKVDPLVSLLMSLLIIYNWSDLMVEHMVILSQESSDEEFCAEVRETVGGMLHGSPCSARAEDIKVYVSSEKCTIEIAVSVENGETCYTDVTKVLKNVQGKLEALQDVERVLITMKA